MKLQNILGIIFVIIVNAFFAPIMVLSVLSKTPVITVISAVSYVVGMFSIVYLVKYLGDKRVQEISIVSLLPQGTKQQKKQEGVGQQGASKESRTS